MFSILLKLRPENGAQTATVVARSTGETRRFSLAKPVTLANPSQRIDNARQSGVHLAILAARSLGKIRRLPSRNSSLLEPRQRIPHTRLAMNTFLNVATTDARHRAEVFYRTLATCLEARIRDSQLETAIEVAKAL